MHQMRRVTWREKFLRSGYFFAALLFHLVVFLMVATVVIWNAPAPPLADDDPKPVVSHPVPPRQNPELPTTGGSGDTPHVDPQPVVVPPSTPQSLIASKNGAYAMDTSQATAEALSDLSLPPVPGAGLDNTGAGPLQGPGTATFGVLTGSANQLAGYLYDFKQTPNHEPTGLSSAQYHQSLMKFVADDWDPRDLEGYYKSAKPLYTSAILIPVMDAQLGPTAFGLGNEVKPSRWIIWYKGTVTPPAPGRYQFAGICDDILLVRIDGRTVLDGSLSPVDKKPFNLPWLEAPGQAYRPLRLGEEFTFSPGESKDIDVIIGEQPGGKFYAALFALKVGETYPNDAKGQPELPLFQIGSDYKLPGGVYPSVNPTVEAWQGSGR